MQRLLRCFALAVLAATVATCAGVPSDSGPVAATVDLLGDRSVIRVSEQLLLRALVRDAGGSELPDRDAAWATTDATVLTVDSTGRAVAVAPGTATISATVDGVAGTAGILVTLVPVRSVVVGASTDSLFVGDSLQLALSVHDSAGNALLGRPTVYRVSDTTKAAVGSTGLLRARGPGGFAVTVTADGVLGGVFFTALEPVVQLRLVDSVAITRYQSIELVPALLTARGTRASGRAVTWSSAHPAVVTVAGGVITPVALGRGVIHASCCGGAADSAVVNVVQGTVREMELDLNAAEYLAGTMEQITGVPLDGDGEIVTVPVTWTSSDTAIALIIPGPPPHQRPMLHARTPGTATITVAYGEFSAGDRIDVYPSLAPVAGFRIDPDTVVLRVGGHAAVLPSLRDSAGAWRSSTVATWRLTDTSVSSISALPDVLPGRRAGTSLLIGTVTAGGQTYADTAVVTVRAGANLRLTWEETLIESSEYAPPLLVYLGATDSLDQSASESGDLELASSDTSVAVVEPAILHSLSDVMPFTLRFRRAGRATITARHDSAAASFQVDVEDDRPFTLRLARPPLLTAGDSVPAVVTVLTESETPSDYPLQWSSSDTAVVRIAGRQTLVARAPGRAFLTVRAGYTRDTVTVFVRSGPAGTSITSLAPVLWRADSAAVIDGAGFDPVPANNAVTLDGVPLTVTAATATRLDVRLPPPSSFRCAAARWAPLVVMVPSGLAADTVPLASAAQVAVAALADTMLLPATARCFEIEPVAAPYTINVLMDDLDPGSSTAFRLRGRASGAVPAAPPAPPSRRPAARVSVDPSLVDLPRSSRRGDGAILDASRRVAQRVGAPAPLLRAAPPRPARSVGDSIGSLVRFRVPDISYPDFCSRYIGVTARRAWTGAHMAIYQDVAIATAFDDTFAQLGAEFESAMLPLIRANFGDPLALDSLLDRDGRITVLVSPAVSAFAAGFVTSCDFYPESLLPSSNVGETIYLSAPPTSTSFPGGAGSHWLWVFRSVLVHEVKHVAAFAERLSRGLPLEESWLEEGSAVVAEELWSRGIYGTTWKGNATYATTLRCDVRPANAECGGRPFAMFNTFALLHDFARSASGVLGYERHSPTGPADGADATFYGGAWSLLRWSIDTYASGEAGFLRALVQRGVTGTANLEAATGRPYAGLMTDWLEASIRDDQHPAPLPRLTQPSWNYPVIFSGMATDFPGDFGHGPFTFRGVPFGTFDITVPVLRGGSASVFWLEGAPSSRLLLELLTPSGTAAAAGVRLRLQRY